MTVKEIVAAEEVGQRLKTECGAHWMPYKAVFRLLCKKKGVFIGFWAYERHSLVCALDAALVACGRRRASSEVESVQTTQVSKGHPKMVQNIIISIYIGIIIYKKIYL